MDLKVKSSSLVNDIIIDGKIVDKNLKIAGIDKKWLQSELKKKSINNIEEVFYAGVDKNKKLIISKKYPDDFNPENKFGIQQALNGLAQEIMNRIISDFTVEKAYVACGEIVLEQHRRKGVAKSLQLNMAEICRRNGLIPIGGCWYGNIASKRTFDSCGRYSRTRLLNVTFMQR